MKQSTTKPKVKTKIKQEEKNKKSHKKLLFLILAILVIIILLFSLDTIKTKNLVTNIIQCENSVVLDKNGETIAILGSERKQEKTTIDKIPQNLKNAYISIEDKRYYKHKGIDIKRTGGAILSYITHKGSATFGGSSITQQLVKNISGDNEASVIRKIQEWLRATEVEIFMDKEQILEAYFNIIYVGPNIYGVKLGAKYYFNKDIEQLNLTECAFLAGINNAPNAYNPFVEKDHTELIKKRTKTVLYAMKEQGYISEEEYKQSVSEVENGIKFQKGEVIAKGNGVYSYHTDALINELIEDISTRKHISEEFAKNYIYMSGFKIYSTQDSNIQKTIENECNNSKYILNSTIIPGATSQCAVVIIDHKTGYVLGCSGGLGEKNIPRGLNRATQTTRQTGSAGKPISVLAPAIAKKIITPATIYDDVETIFDDGKEGYKPTDYNGFQGKINVRRAVESSQNIPFVKIMEQLTPSESINFMRDLGITTLTDVDDNLNLALGGLDKGISPLEMAGAYATIANDGTYIEPTFYEKIENINGVKILISKQKKKTVFSDAVAFILKDLLKQPVIGSNGTATYCKINNIDVSAKTGTTNENYDRWLCGFTNYYTTVTWFGFDQNETINYKGNNPAGVIWSSIMKSIHKDLAPSSFVVPKGVSALAVCKETGMLANYGCKDTYTEYFINGNIPQNCTTHGGTANN